MPRWKIIGLVLVLGLGIGGCVPLATSWWYDQNQSDDRTLSRDSETISTNSSAVNVYHFDLKKDVLSVIEGKPGASGKVIITGLNVHSWPKDMLELAPKVEFYSLDEVQSFIDTVNEPLWQE